MARSFFCMILLFLLIVVASAIDYNNGPKPEVVDDQQKQVELPPSEPEYSEEPETEELEEKLPNHDESYNYDHNHIPTTPDHDNHHINNYINTIGIQGFILSKSDQTYTPLVGAVTKISCVTEDKNGERAPFYLLSHKTDERGFFLATFSLSELLGSKNKLKLKDCKAFLEESPVESSCKFPTDVNYGVSGAQLSSFRFLPEKVMALYTVGPFICTSEPNYSVPNGHY